jgi:competence ComEA-like helix-hairpin-helix protein
LKRIHHKKTQRQPQRSQKGYFLIFAVVFAFFVVNSSFAQEERINVNTASAQELLRLPGIGRALAARIVDYRRKHGSFKRPQEIIVVRGLSAKRYRQIAHLIRI